MSSLKRFTPWLTCRNSRISRKSWTSRSVQGAVKSLHLAIIIYVLYILLHITPRCTPESSHDTRTSFGLCSHQRGSCPRRTSWWCNRTTSSSTSTLSRSVPITTQRCDSKVGSVPSSATQGGGDKGERLRKLIKLSIFLGDLLITVRPPTLFHSGTDRKHGIGDRVRESSLG
jgi:hypothetical protein